MSNRIDLTDEISDLFLTAVSIEVPSPTSISSRTAFSTHSPSWTFSLASKSDLASRSAWQIPIVWRPRLAAGRPEGARVEEVARSDESLDLHRGPRPAHVSVVRGSSPVVRPLCEVLSDGGYRSRIQAGELEKLNDQWHSELHATCADRQPRVPFVKVEE